MRTLIKVGEVYGSVKVIEIAQKKPKKYKVQCLRCGKTYVTTGQGLLEYNAGCHDCREKDKTAAKYGPYIGQKFGQLEVLGIAGKGKRGIVLAKCLCHKCQKETTVSFSRLLSGERKECCACARKNLDTGREIHIKLCVDGTSLDAIKPDRKVNSNSKTGYKGVSEMRSGKYRAYINFKRKHYHLGTYDKIEDAVKARQAAEQEIYGKFLETHKEAWNGNMKKG